MDQGRRWLPGVMRGGMPVVVIVLLTGVLSLQLAPTAIAMGRDNGIFAYTARVMVEGGALYRDAWDNKLPGVYAINAGAFALFGVNRWAIWLADTIFVAGASVLMFALLRSVFAGRRWVVWTGTLSFVMLTRAPNVLWDVNFTEAYALLPQMVVLVLGWRMMRGAGWRTGCAVGLAASGTFLIKQTTIGVALGFGPALVLTTHPLVRRSWRVWLGAPILGGLAGLGGVALLLAAAGVLDDGLDAAFTSTVALHTWIGGEDVSLLKSVVQTFGKSVVPELYGPVVVFLVLGAVAPLARLRRDRAGVEVEKAEAGPAGDRVTLSLWALLAALADLALVNLSGRHYEHYYATLTPTFVLLIAFGLDTFAGLRSGRRWRIVTAGAALIVLVNFGYRPVENLWNRMHWIEGNLFGPVRQSESATWLVSHTDPGVPVLVWGATSGDNFEADRRSPTAYHYAYPLIVPDYTTDAMLAGVVGDLTRNLPLVIMDRGLEDGVRVPPLGAADRAAWLALGGRADTFDLGVLYDWVADHCREITREATIVYYACEAGS